MMFCSSVALFFMTSSGNDVKQCQDSTVVIKFDLLMVNKQALLI